MLIPFFPSACSVPSSHPPGSGIQRFPVSLPMGDMGKLISEVPSRPFCDPVITHIWLSTSNSLNLSSGMGSATRKWIQDELSYRCLIQAASHSFVSPAGFEQFLAIMHSFLRVNFSDKYLICSLTGNLLIR